MHETEKYYYIDVLYAMFVVYVLYVLDVIHVLQFVCDASHVLHALWYTALWH